MCGLLREWVERTEELLSHLADMLDLKKQDAQYLSRKTDSVCLDVRKRKFCKTSELQTKKIIQGLIPNCSPIQTGARLPVESGYNMLKCTS